MIRPMTIDDYAAVYQLWMSCKGMVLNNLDDSKQGLAVFLNRDEAAPKSKTKGRSLGVEHASFDDLQKALSGVLGNYDDDNHFDVGKSDLMRLGLLMGTDSHKRREYLGEQLRIGYSNGKQLLKRLELFGVVKAKVEEVMIDYQKS